MKKTIIGLLFSLLIILSIDFYLINISQSKGTTQKEKIVLIEKRPLQWYDSKNKILDYKIIHTDYYFPLKNSIMCFIDILSSFGYDINLEKFLYESMEMNPTLSSEVKIEGSAKPLKFYRITKKYLEENELSINVDYIGLYGYNFLIKKINNGWPAIVWLDSGEKVPREDKWQYAEIVVIYKIDKDYAYIIDPIAEEKKKIKVIEFKNRWLTCGSYAVIY